MAPTRLWIAWSVRNRCLPEITEFIKYMDPGDVLMGVNVMRIQARSDYIVWVEYEGSLPFGGNLRANVARVGYSRPQSLPMTMHQQHVLSPRLLTVRHHFVL
jgi:hypothetical protein